MDFNETQENNNEIDKRKFVWLGFGIGSIALVIGYMVGGSTVPAFSIAVPAVFGLVVTALGFIGSSNYEKTIDELKSIITKAEPVEVEKIKPIVSEQIEPLVARLDSLKKESAINAEKIGKVLVLFTVCYAVGLAIGTYVRATNLYTPLVKRELPWTAPKVSLKPITADTAVKWIILQEQLLQLGYSQEQIMEIYRIGPETLVQPLPSQISTIPTRTPVNTGATPQPETKPSPDSTP